MAWFRKKYVLNRTYRDNTTETVTIIADVQPQNDTGVSPIGTTDRAVRIYTDNEIFPSNQPPTQTVKKDIITYHGRDYKITKVEKYDSGLINHYEGTAVSYDLQPITLYKSVREDDGQGGYDDTEKTLGTIYAKINAPQMNMTSGTTGSMESMTQSMIIDDDAIEGIDTTCQIEFKGERFEILYIDRSKYDVLTLTTQRLNHRG